MILDKSHNTYWGNVLLRDKVFKVKPYYHLFGHEHNNQGVVKYKNTVFANGAILDDQYNLREKYNLFTYR